MKDNVIDINRRKLTEEEKAKLAAIEDLIIYVNSVLGKATLKKKEVQSEYTT